MQPDKSISLHQKDMKVSFLKAMVVIGLAMGSFAIFVSWLRFPPFLLAWPSVALASVGMTYSWIVSAVIFVGGIVWLCFWSRNRRWKQVVIAGISIPFSYCATAYYFPHFATIPLPATTPYDSTPEHRVAYLQAYAVGYLNTMIGNQRTQCFAPEDETRGYYDGQYQGAIIWYRMLGHTMTESEKQAIGNSAAIDGVRPIRK